MSNAFGQIPPISATEAPSGRRDPARRTIGALVLGLMVALGASAQERRKPLLPAPGAPVLAFPPLSVTGGESHPDAAREFRATVLQDLKRSGVFRLVDPGGIPGGNALTSLMGLPDAGSNLVVRAVTRTVGQGRLLVESEVINLQNQAVVLKKSFLGEASVVRRMAHRLSDLLVGKVTGTPGVADSAIVFARGTAPGVSEIFGMDPDGTDLRQITTFGSLTGHPAMAPDGRLAVVSYRSGPPQVWGQLKPAGPFQRLYPKDGAAGAELGDLAWSPDGRRLAFVQGTRKGLSDIVVLDLAGLRAARLTDGAHLCKSPAWNPAGTELAFISDRDGTPQVWAMAVDGGRIRPLTSGHSPKARVAWSPQGDRLAFLALQPSGANLVTMGPGGEDHQKIATSPEPVQSLCWAPDGRSVLFGVTREGRPALRMAGLDGRIQDLPAGPGGFQDPQWVKNRPALPSMARTDVNFAHPGAAPKGAAPIF